MQKKSPVTFLFNLKDNDALVKILAKGTFISLLVLHSFTILIVLKFYDGRGLLKFNLLGTFYLLCAFPMVVAKKPRKYFYFYNFIAFFSLPWIPFLAPDKLFLSFSLITPVLFLILLIADFLLFGSAKKNVRMVSYSLFSFGTSCLLISKTGMAVLGYPVFMMVSLFFHLQVILLYEFLLTAMKEKLAKEKAFEALKKAKEELSQKSKSTVEKLQTELYQARRLDALGQLAGGIAHDFNNVLAGISGYAEIINQKKTVTPDELSRYMAIILQSTQRAANLNNQLLSFARRGNFKKVSFTLNALVIEVVDLLRHSINRNIEIVKNLEKDPPPILGDPNQVQSAILNIGINARDAMEQGGALTFKTDTLILDKNYVSKFPYKFPTGEYVRLIIMDTGQGMTEEVKDKIFEPFFTTKEVGKGTGLGLASAYGTVKSHKGIIQVETELGVGTTFKLLFPVSKVEAGPTQIPPSIQDQKISGTIMVIDDEEIVRTMTMEAAKLIGCETIACSNGLEAIDKFQTHQDKIDVVLIDMIMPKINGAECFRALQKIRPDVKVILLSGFSENEEVQELLNSGAKGFLQKPFKFKELTDLFSQWMTKKPITA